MNLQDTPMNYGAVSRLNHWLGAALVLLLLGIGLYFDDMPRGEEKLFWLNLHMSLGLVALVPLVFRLLWRRYSGWPRPVQQSSQLQRLTGIVHRLLLLAIAVMLVTGPLLPWTNGYPVQLFDAVTLASPSGKMPVLHEILENIHVITGRVLMILIGLHVLGAVKHSLVDRDTTLRRMLGTRLLPQK